jgi:hypothetical protein
MRLKYKMPPKLDAPSVDVINPSGGDYSSTGVHRIFKKIKK